MPFGVIVRVSPDIVYNIAQGLLAEGFIGDQISHMATGRGGDKARSGLNERCIEVAMAQK